MRWVLIIWIQKEHRLDERVLGKRIVGAGGLERAEALEMIMKEWVPELGEEGTC